MAGVVFGLVSDRAKFVISAVCGAVGMAITMLFVPDISGLDLSEGGWVSQSCRRLTHRTRLKHAVGLRCQNLMLVSQSSPECRPLSHSRGAFCEQVADEPVVGTDPSADDARSSLASC